MYKTNFKVFAHRKRFGKRTKLVSMMLAVLMVVSLTAASFSMTASAAATSPGDGADSDVTLQVTGGTSFSVTVPTELPIVVNARNQVEVATNARVVNNSSAPIDVVSATVEADNGWELVDIDTDFTKVPVDSKQFGMTIDDFATIFGGDYATVNYNASVAVQSRSYDRSPIGHVVFVVDWNDGTPKLGPNDIVFSGLNSWAQQMTSHEAYDPNDYTYSYWTTPTVDYPDLPNSGTVTLPDNAYSITISNSSLGTEYTQIVSGNSTYEIKNLIPNKTYQYTVKDSQGSTLKSGTAKQTGSLRMIDLGEGSFNVRDLGGWNADGGTLKYGLIYRGGEVNDHRTADAVMISEESIDYAKNVLNIGYEVDLRHTSDGGGVGTGSAFGSDVDYSLHKIGMYNTNWNDAQKERYSTALITIMDNVIAGKPGYVHCIQGADRTESVLLLLEAICGVSQSDIDVDFELSATNRLRNTSDNVDGGRVRTANSYKNYINDINTMPGNTFRDRAIAYCIMIGVDLDRINAFRNAMIEGTPSNIQSYTETEEVFVPSTASLDTRISSSVTDSIVLTQDDKAEDILVTDYISAKFGDIFTISTDASLNRYGRICGLYNEGKEFIGYSKASSTAWTIDSDKKHATVDVSKMLSEQNPRYNMSYIRISLEYHDVNNVSIERTRVYYH